MSNRRRLRIAPEAPDGRHATGRVNAYKCDSCGRYTVTIDRDEGVTPMFLACRADGTEDFKCNGRAVSLGYPQGPTPDWAVPAWEWYKPSRIEMHGLSPEMRDHVQRGGLMLRKIVRAASQETAAGDA